MTCCIGRARIYFREPINYWLVYQLPNGSLGSVTAPEPLTTNCEQGPVPGERYRVLQRVTYASGRTVDWSPVSTASFPWPIQITDISNVSRWRFLVNDYYGSTSVTKCSALSNPNLNTCASVWPFEIRFDPVNPNLPPNYTFKVIGTETGTEYANIGGLEECPTVISNTCVMGEERYVDVDMSNASFLRYPDCIGHRIVNDQFHITITRGGLIINTGSGIEYILKTLNMLPGCLPEYRVICCPNGSCEPEEQCPPDTDCSLECDGLVCCYKNGRVIRSFRR